MKPWIFITILFPAFQGAAATCAFPTEVQQALDSLENGEKLMRYDQLHRYAKSDPPIHDTCLALVFHKLGVALARHRDYRAAIGHYQQALALRRQHLSPDHPSIIRTLNNIGVNYYNLNDLAFNDSVSYYYEKSLALNYQRRDRGLPLTSLYPRTLVRFSRHNKWMGDYESARYNLLAAIRYFEDTGKRSRDLAVAYNDLSAVLSKNLRLPDSAIVFANRAIVLYNSLAGNERRGSDLPNAYLNLGLAHEVKLNLQGDPNEFNKAVAAYQTALAGFYRLGASGRWKVHAVLNNLGVLYNSAGKYQQALDSLQKAATYHRTEKAFDYLARDLDNMGDALVGLGRHSEALAIYQEALQHSFVGYQPGSSFDLPDLERHYNYDKIGALKTLRSLAKTQREANHIAAALESYAFIDQYIDHLRRSFTFTGSRISLSRLAKPIYEQAIRTCMLSGEPPHLATAFHYAEKTKALALLETVKSRQVARSKFSDRKQQTLYTLLRQMEHYERELAYEKIYEGSEEKVGALLQGLMDQRRQVKEVLQEIREENPAFYQQQFEAEVASLAELQQKALQKDQAMLAYFTGDSLSALFVITPSDIQMVELDDRQPLEQMVLDLDQALKGYYEDPEAAPLTEYLEAFCKQANALYEALLKPAGTLPTHLIIVPDDFLHFLPFEVLLTQKPAQPGNYLSYPYLVREKIISYNFSASLYLEALSQKKNRRPGKTWVGFAPGFLEDEDYLPLQRSVEEVRELATLMQGKSYLKAKADAGQLQRSGGDYRILHLATHALLEPSIRIVMADTSLYMSDISLLDLQADLVVLRACETNVGLNYTGEGVASLNRSFVSAGAGSVLTTALKVQDEIGGDLMELMYRELLAGQPKDVALQKAKLALLQEQHPYFWAGFILYGDTAPVFHKNRPFWVWICLAFSILLMGWWLGKSRK